MHPEEERNDRAPSRLSARNARYSRVGWTRDFHGGTLTKSGTEARFHRVSKATKAEIGFYKEGVSLEKTLGAAVDDLVDRTVSDRLSLAQQFLDMGDRMLRSRGNFWRAGIARHYYSMYHAMRASALQFHRGDDYEAHSELSQKGVPSDFPDRGLRINQLKDARILRNEADYDPYPLKDAYFQAEAKTLAPVARDFLAAAEAYIRTKGNKFL